MRNGCTVLVSDTAALRTLARSITVESAAIGYVQIDPFATEGFHHRFFKATWAGLPWSPVSLYDSYF